MEITLEKLLSLVEETYELGLSGCADLKKQEIDDLLCKYQIRDVDDFRVWKIEDLRKMPDGTIFMHLLRGRCWITSKANGTKQMQFDRGFHPMDFNSPDDPWDKPMRLMHSER